MLLALLVSQDYCFYQFIDAHYPDELNKVIDICVKEEPMFWDVSEELVGLRVLSGV